MGGEIIGTSLALAPETMGVSLAVGLGAVIVNDLVAEHVTEYAKEEIPKVAATIQKTAKHERDHKKGRYVPLCHQSQSCRCLF